MLLDQLIRVEGFTRHPLAVNVSNIRSTEYSDSMLFFECKGGLYYCGQVGGSSRHETRSRMVIDQLNGCEVD